LITGKRRASGTDTRRDGLPAVQHGATKSREQTDLICIELRKLSLSQELLVAADDGTWLVFVVPVVSEVVVRFLLSGF